MANIKPLTRSAWHSPFAIRFVVAYMYWYSIAVDPGTM